MRVALYARCSTEENEDKEKQKQNVETQFNHLRNYCKMKGWETSSDLEYHDYATGMDNDRPELARMMDDSHRGLFDIILIFKIDRITRSPLKLLLLLEELQDPKTKKYRVNLVSATEGVDTSSPFTEGMMLMLGIFGKIEREGIIERVTAGISRWKKENPGKTWGRQRRNDIDLTLAAALVEVEGLRPAARKLSELLGTNVPESTLRDHLKAAGLYVPNRTGRPREKATLEKEGSVYKPVPGEGMCGGEFYSAQGFGGSKRNSEEGVQNNRAQVKEDYLQEEC